jgi:hypothetical protein
MAVPYAEHTPLVPHAETAPKALFRDDGVARLAQVIERVEDDQISLVELGFRSYFFGTRMMVRNGFDKPLTEVFTCGFSRPQRGQTPATPIMTVLMLPASLGIWIGSIWLMASVVFFDIGATFAKMLSLPFSFFGAGLYWFLTGGFVGTVDNWPRFKIFVIFVHNWAWIAMIPFQVCTAATYYGGYDYDSYGALILGQSMFMLFFWFVLYTTPFIFLMLLTTFFRPNIAASFIALTIETVMGWPSHAVPMGANPELWGQSQYRHTPTTAAPTAGQAPAYAAHPHAPQHAPTPSYVEAGHVQSTSTSSKSGF